MASEVFFTRHHHHHNSHHHSTSFGGLADDLHNSAHASSRAQRSVGPTRSGAALTFPPLYLDPASSANPTDPPPNSTDGVNTVQQQANFVLGSTFYHHPELHALVSNHLTDASANAHGAAAGNAHNFLNSIFAGIGSNEDDSDSDENGAAAAEGASAVPQPKISSEFIALNEDLVPASLDMHGDMLPAEQHPSYPFGNLFGPLSGMVSADSAIMGGPHMSASSGAAGSATDLGESIAALGLNFGGGLDGFTNIGQASHGRRGAVINSWNSFTNKASSSKIVGSGGAPAQWDAEQDRAPAAAPSASPMAASFRKLLTATAQSSDSDLQAERIRSARKLGLAPNLTFRTSTSTVLAPPSWPFRRAGPGSTSYSALLRPTSNIYGIAPASQAVAATLGGLPASAKIVKEVWSDLALEELIPLHVGSTSATRHSASWADDAEDLLESGSTEAARRTARRNGKKRRKIDPEPDDTFARRVATMEPDPLDLLGPVSREIRGQAATAWGTATRRRAGPITAHGAPGGGPPRRRYDADYPTRTEDEAAEVEHDDTELGFQYQDRLRYGFHLPPATYTWLEQPENSEAADESERSPTLRAEHDGIGWSTAKRVFVSEQRDRVLPELASRAGASTGTGSTPELGRYQIRSVRANLGLVPRPEWRWSDGPRSLPGPEQQLGSGHAGVGEVSMMTSSSSYPSRIYRSRHSIQSDEEDREGVYQHHQPYAGEEYEHDEIEDGEEDAAGTGTGNGTGDEDEDEDEDWEAQEEAELQHALLQAYGSGAGDGDEDGDGAHADQGDEYSDQDAGSNEHADEDDADEDADRDDRVSLDGQDIVRDEDEDEDEVASFDDDEQEQAVQEQEF
ncbi:hypothetical protein BCV70DRAFT_202143 [Testicularia cyperi]|uniref:Uncharacterized protein n=1 Tax=Testicularia cyperi TaxID=1882483 RepID=A0A317XJ93_9BASI|nr:hypothetical protein BCV70DRAFT_202143 [Testicularia cyperi]